MRAQVTGVDAGVLRPAWDRQDKPEHEREEDGRNQPGEQLAADGGGAEQGCSLRVPVDELARHIGYLAGVDDLELLVGLLDPRL
jgi:hypothetical protein